MRIALCMAAVLLVLFGRAAPSQAADAGTGCSLCGPASRGEFAQAALLLERGALVNATDPASGFTPLVGAIWSRHADIALLLLRHRADPNIPATTGSTALMFAGATSDPLLAEALIRAGADVNARAKDGTTALGITAQLFAKDSARRLAVVQVLLAASAKPNGADDDGVTPLSALIDQYAKSASDKAVRGDVLAAIKLLLSAGADPNEPAAVRAATSVGANSEDQAIVWLLLAYGGNRDALLAAWTQAQQQSDWCASPAATSDQTITGCTALIQSGRQAPADLANAYNRRGLTNWKKGLYDPAVADFTQAIAAKPDLAQAYDNRGIAYQARGLYDKAIADYAMALLYNPGDEAVFKRRDLAFEAKNAAQRKPPPPPPPSPAPPPPAPKPAPAKPGPAAASAASAAFAAEVLKSLVKDRDYRDLQALYDQQKATPGWTAGEEGQAVARRLALARADAGKVTLLKRGLRYSVGGDTVTDDGILVHDIATDREYHAFIVSAVVSNIMSAKAEPKVEAALARFRASRK